LHPDYYALYLGNHIFGGSGLVSILSEEIREKKGLAYSAYSYFSQILKECCTSCALICLILSVKLLKKSKGKL
jgi:predicted Zn-dependent peptidase